MKDFRLCDNANLECVLGLCKKYDLGIEVQSFHDPYILEKEPDLMEKHIDCMKEFSNPKSLHAPFWELNMGSKMHGVVDETITMYAFAYEIAIKLNCKEVVVHNGYFPNTYSETGWIKRAAEQWRNFLSEKKEICFYIENQFELSADVLCRLIDEVDMDNLKICLDVGHVNVFSTEPVTEWIKGASDRIGYVHLHNNNGKSDLHNGLEDGTIPIKEVIDHLERYAPDAVLCIETQIPELEKSYLFLKSVLEG